MNKRLQYICSMLLPVLLLGVTAQAQVFDHDYQPIQIKGRIPLAFLARAQGTTAIALPSSGKNTNSLYGITSSIFLKQKFLEANIYYNDTVSAYVNKVMTTLLHNNHTLRSRISPFVTRSTIPNANTWQDGTILINIGLISRLENESQLAFVLAHELTHYLEEHSYEIFELASSEKELLDDPLQIVSRSDNNELIADKNALQLMRNAGYDSREGIKALELIEYDPTHRLDIIAALSTPEIRLNERELCDFRKIEQEYKLHNNFVFSNGKRPIDINARMRNLRALYIPSDSIGSKFCAPKKEFENIREIANMEMIENSYQRSDYIRGAHSALMKLQQDPKNRYAAVRAAQSLYGIVSYSKYGNLKNILFDKGLLKETDLAKFYCFINTQQNNYLQQFVYRSVEKLYDQQQSDPEMIIVMAQTTELYLGVDIAQKFYLKYIDLYPHGNNISLAQLKTNR
jgi:beta-barrel assembly-enhancing protease